LNYSSHQNLCSMLFIIYFFILVILLIIFILFTAIGLTIKFKIISLKETKKLKSRFAVKWLFFSHNFLIEIPHTKKKTTEEPEESKAEKVVETWKDEKKFERSDNIAEYIPKTECKVQAEKRRDIKKREFYEKTLTSEDNEKIEIKKKTGDIEKTESNDGIKEKERIKKKYGAKLNNGMTTKEIFQWSFKAFNYLRKPLFCLFSDLLNGIKIKRLESCMTFCLQDPSDTGILCGFLHAIAGFVYSRCKHCNFSIKPEFMDQMFDFQGNLEIRIKIHSLILPFIKFIFNWNTLSFTYSIVKDILQRKWKSTRKPKWKFA
jgi:hypothetical protein